MADLQHLEEVRTAMVNENKRNGYNESGSFVDFCKVIKDSFKRVLMNANTNGSDTTEYNEKGNYGHSFKDFLIKDWETCKEHKIDNVVSGIIDGTVSFVNSKDSSFVNLEDGSVHTINGQEFDTEDLEIFNNDNISLFVSFSKLEEEITSPDGEVFIPVGERFIFTVWFVYNKNEER